MPEVRSGPARAPAAGGASWSGLAAGAVLMVLIAWAVFFPFGEGAIYWLSWQRPFAASLIFLLVLCATFACALVLARRADLGLEGRMNDVRARGFMVVLCAVLLAATLASAFLVQRRFAGSGDERAYLFEAQTFLAGRLWNAAPAGARAMGGTYIFVVGDKWVGQYPPAWPGLLAIAQTLGVSAWAAGALLAVAGLAALYLLVARAAGRVPGLLAAVLYAATPFTVLTAGSLFSHQMAATLALGVALALRISREEGRPAWAFAAGLAAGMLGMTRLVTAAVVLSPFAVAMLRRRDWRGLVALGVGGLPFAVALLWYQWRLTGSPLEPVYWIAGRRVDHLYFDAHNVGTGIYQTGKRWMQLACWWSPAMVAIWPIALWLKGQAKTLDAADFVFPLGVFTFMFYPLSAGNEFGPRYYYDFFPLMVYSVATSLPLYTGRVRRLVEVAAVLTIVFDLALWPPLAVTYRRISIERSDLFDQVAASNLRNAVVCIRSATGVRLTMPANDLPLNDVDGAGPVLYAQCGLTSFAALARAYPNRAIWTYDRSPNRVHGRLAIVRSALSD